MLEALDESIVSKEFNWETFDLKECTKCNLCKTRRNVVLPKIIPNAKIMFIGDIPNALEDMYADSFIGDMGNIFESALNQVGISKYECSFANTIFCTTPDDREATKDEIKACYDILDYQIKLANPEILVPVGNVALKRIAKKSGITKYNGSVIEHENYPNKKIIPLIHPNSTHHDPKNLDRILLGLKKVKDIADGKKLYLTSEVTYVDDYNKFDLMIKDLSSKQYFALDIETSSTNWVEGYIICISFSNCKGKSYVLPWVVGDEKFYDCCRKNCLSSAKRGIIESVDEFCNLMQLNKPAFKWSNTDVKERLQDLLKNPIISKLLHNYAFDYKFLESAGLLIEGVIWDTMILHYLLEETKYTHGLDKCCLKYTNYGEYWKGLSKWKKETKKSCDTYAVFPLEDLSLYAGTDSDVTFQIFEIFYPKIIEENQLTLYLHFLLPLTKMLMQTEKNGIKLDLTYANHCKKVLEDVISIIDTKLNEYTKDIVINPDKPDVKGVNFGSPQQVAEYLYNRLGLPILSKTEKGAPSTGEDVLEKLVPLHEVPKLLIERRKREKLLNTYIIGFIDKVWKDGKIHPNFLITGTETGRLSAKNPAVQTLPKNPEKGSDIYELGINIRNLLEVDDPENYYLVETDYSQAELRLVADFSQDKNLCKAFREGRDLHSELAVRAFHPDRVADMEAGIIKAQDIVTETERFDGKTSNFSFLNGKSPKMYAIENNIPLEKGQLLFSTFWQAYYGVTQWKISEIGKARANNGVFTTIWGRKRRIPKIFANDDYLRGAAEREGINFLFQSVASDCTLWSVIKVLRVCGERGYDVKTNSFVHDSALYRVHKSCINEFLTLKKDIMLNPPGVSIPMESDDKVGYKLGSLKKWINKNGIWQEK